MLFRGGRSMAKPRRKAGRPFGNTREETHGRLLDAACSCFAELGYSRASNKQIAETAGITSGSLYHYFGSKAELFGAVYGDVIERLLDAYRIAATEHETCIEQLCGGLERIIVLSREHPRLVEFAASAYYEIQRQSELNALLGEEHFQVFDLFRGLLEAGVERGEISAEVDLETAVNVIVACVSGLAIHRGRLESEEEFAAALRAFQCVLRGTLFARPRREAT